MQFAPPISGHHTHLKGKAYKLVSYRGATSIMLTHDSSAVAQLKYERENISWSSTS